MTFTTEHAAMAKASRMVHDIADEVTSEQTRLDTEVTGFVGSGWTGVAADEYRAAWQEWCRGTSDVLSALRTEAQLISASQAAYEVSDAGSTDQMSPLSARLQSRLGWSAMQFSMDLDELLSVIGSMEAFEARLQGRLTDLEDVIGELHGSWTGAAAAAQRAAHDKLATAAAEVHQAVVDMRRAAEHAHGSYTAAAETNLKMWSQVR